MSSPTPRADLPVIDLGIQLEELRETGRCVWLVPDERLRGERLWVRPDGYVRVEIQHLFGPGHAFITAPHAKGETLAVGEEWCLIDNSGLVEFTKAEPTRYYEYKADNPDAPHPGEWPAEHADDPDCPHWQPAGDMPPAAARLFVEVESEPELWGDASTCVPLRDSGVPEPCTRWAWRYELGRVEE